MIVCVPETIGVEPSLNPFKYGKRVIGRITNGYTTRDASIPGNKAVLVDEDSCQTWRWVSLTHLIEEYPYFNLLERRIHQMVYYMTNMPFIE